MTDVLTHAWQIDDREYRRQEERRGIDTVLITGTVTNVCCESTARDAADVGLRVVLVADGCAATNDRTHNATLHTVYRTFGDVRPAAEVIDLLSRPPTP